MEFGFCAGTEGFAEGVAGGLADAGDDFTAGVVPATGFGAGLFVGLADPAADFVGGAAGFAAAALDNAGLGGAAAGFGTGFAAGRAGADGGPTVT